MNLRFYEKICEWYGEGKQIAVCTIISTVGSTPRKPGTKMLVSSDMELYGTIGGGCVEADVIFAARDVMKTLVPRVINVDIKAKTAEEIDMLCGGEITFLVEPVMPDYKLLICGGGHISKAIAHVAQGLDFKISIIDDRPQFANKQRFPDVDEAICCPYEEIGEHFEFTPATFVVVVTRGHSGDEICLRTILKSPACFVAMVGSRSKWAALKRNLTERGYTKEQLERVESPAGLDIGSITPEEIAVSIIAQIIQVRTKYILEGFPQLSGAEVGKGKGEPGKKASKNSTRKPAKSKK